MLYNWDRQGDRPWRTISRARACRRGDRV